MKLEDFDFDLPEELIALEPLKSRDKSRLLTINSAAQIKDRNFSDIVNLISEQDVIVFNNTKVIKARVNGAIEGKKAQITLLKQVSGDENIWQVLGKPGKRFRKGNFFEIPASDIKAEILFKDSEGIISLKFNGDKTHLFKILDKCGSMPLPPYIEKKRKADLSDDDRYQTVFAKTTGAVAAPTAGLHFTDKILNKLKDKGVKLAEITLHVGAGTFLPVRVENIRDHQMHSEYFEINEKNAKIINTAKANGGKVISIGTTSLRALESSTEQGIVLPKCEETDIFIYPSYEFKIVDCLVTNFHLPKSTLLMLVSAFVGTKNIKKLYSHAIKNNYRFFSYGDSCFMEKSNLLSENSSDIV